jgi:hypothetical protein
MIRVLSSVTVGIGLTAASVCLANTPSSSQTYQQQQQMQQQNVPVLTQNAQQVIVQQAPASTHVPGAWSRIEGCRSLFLLDGKPTLAFLQGIHHDGTVFMESTLKENQTTYTPMLGGFLYQAYGDGSERFHVLKVERLVPDTDLSGQRSLQSFVNGDESFVTILGADAIAQQGSNQAKLEYANTRWIITLDDGRRIDVIGQCSFNH